MTATATTATTTTPAGGTAGSPVAPIVLLESGDCLTRDEFERRYQALPHLNKAEFPAGHFLTPVSSGLALI